MVAASHLTIQRYRKSKESEMEMSRGHLCPHTEHSLTATLSENSLQN